MQNGNLLISLRNKKKLTQQDLANYLNVSLKTYQLYEENVRTMKLEELNLLSNFYGVSFNYLMGLSNSLNYYNTRINIDYKYLRFSLRYVRRLARVTVKDFSKKVHVSVSTISNYEKNPRKVNITYLYAFAKYFHVSLDYICGKTLKKEVF